MLYKYFCATIAVDEEKYAAYELSKILEKNSVFLLSGQGGLPSLYS